MKKTLTMMALLGAMTPLAQAEVYWTDGLDETSAQNYTFTKYAYSGRGYGDEYMCFATSASNILAWWQDRVEASGALIIPEDAPRGEEIWDKIRLEWKNLTAGGQPNRVLQYYLTGCTGYAESTNPSKLTDKGLAFIAERGGYYPHLAGARYDMNDTVYPDNSMVKYVDVRGYNSTSNPKEYPDGFTSYEGASKYLVELLQAGYGGVLKTVSTYPGPHAMTFYAVETDAEGLITKIWYNDNNYNYHTLDTGVVSAGAANKTNPENSTMAATVGYGGAISSFTMLRTKGMQFDTYGMTMTGAAGEEDLFSHYLNLTVDGADYSLKYDLRNALSADSPVDSQGQKTGDIFLKSGHLSLVDSTAEQQKFDKGGSTEGVISFGGADAGVQRTLTVNRTGTIAAEISINAASGNTLEVTAGNTAAFGKLTGEGNLDKTGSGTAEVTGEVTLKGSIAVQEGTFVLGSSAELSKDTVLTVGAAGSVESKADAAVLLTISSGTHTNDGTMTLETTVAGGTLKGSGSFAKVTVEEDGTLIVGNSPGHQEYTDMLTVSGGDVVFCVAGLETASSGTATGWGSDTYSVIHMQDHVFNYESGQIFIDLSGAAAEALTLGAELTLVDGMANTLTEAQLAALAANTAFRLTAEEGAAVTFNAGTLVQPNFSYGMSGSSLVLTIVPEPATTTLSLLALAGLCARRRR